MPLPRSGRGGRGSSANAPTHRRGRGSSSVGPTHRRGRGSPADPTPIRRRDRDRSLLSDSRSSVVHFDVPVDGGREVIVCKEQHVAEPASAQTLHRLDALSLKGLCYTTEMEGSSSTVASLPSPHDTTDAPPLLDRCLSSSPIWKRRVFEWAITFYTIKDVGGYFRIFPDVGGPFQSKDEADKAIDRYLTERKNLTMGIGLSEVDKIIQKCRFFPDGTKKRLKAGQAIGKRRDTTYQLVQAVVYKYNDHHKLFGDSAYEVKDVLGEPPLWEEDNCRMYMHMNFTAKTKGRDDLFFAEVTYVSGDAALAVNCCCIVKSFDNGPCFACGTTMKHPSDGIAYSGGRRNGSYCLPFGSGPVRATWCHDEDSDEEMERLRSLFGGARATARVPLEA